MTLDQSSTNGIKVFSRAALGVCVLMHGLMASARSEIVTLKNGMEIQGAFGETSSLGSDALSPTGARSSVDVKLIQFVDDGLRRTFFSKYQLQSRRPDVEQLELIKLEQPVTTSGRGLGLLGSAAGEPTPFDTFGRRVFPLQSDRGRLEIVQGITEVSPVFTRIEALQTSNAFAWDMRVATSSIPRDQIVAMLRHRLDQDTPDERLKAVRLYLQAEWYREAEEELTLAIGQFPELSDLKDQLRQLQLLRARQQMGEIRLRRNAGQFRLADQLLASIPTDGVPVETLAEIQELAESGQQVAAGIEKVRELLTAQKEKVPAGPAQAKFLGILEEMLAALSPQTLPWFTEYLRLQGDTGIDDQKRLALAISGWLTAGSARDSMTLAQSLMQVRELAESYLASHDAAERERLLKALGSEEGAAPEWLAKVVAALAPPRAPESQPPAGAEVPEPGNAGMIPCEVAGFEPDRPVKYQVQLPPEYDHAKRYPAIVTLHAVGSSPELQIDWWAGPYDPQLKMRLGQASRHGYIVIAPAWPRATARAYQHSAREHAAVLFALRDACQRFSIDVDRVFLSGHSSGGDAAWDMGLAHPDLWAGVIPIAAAARHDRPDAPRYIQHYWPNARYVPMYFVAGEKDLRRVEINSSEFNRYLHTTGFDTMIVEYRGRGHEHFSDEIQRIFRWMALHRRDFFPDEFEVVSRRTWDNFFWYVELNGLSPRSMIDPATWPAKDAARPLPIKGSVRQSNAIYVSAKAHRVAALASPEMVDFEAGVSVFINGKRMTRRMQPSIEVLLEDARTRGDRQHPFWARTVSEKPGETP